jgi:hypothetical protein
MLLTTELLEQERDLERELQTCLLENAQTVATSGEQALVGAGLLIKRETSESISIAPLEKHQSVKTAM